MTPPPLPKAMLVDLDDTLLDDSGAAEECWRDACGLAAGRGLPFGPAALREAVRAFSSEWWSDPGRHRAGRLDLPAARRLHVAGALEALGRPDPAFANEVADAYTAFRRERVRLFPGALEALASLRERGVRLAMLTNGHPSIQRPKIERFALAPYFERIHIEGEVGFGKPEERAYLHALERLGVAPADAWMVGDNLEWEVAVPQRLGLHAVWVDHRGGGLPPDAPAVPDRIVRLFAEIAA
jgi:putative hydrolase of the HAD superfamily